MAERPYITIVTPTYNSGEYLEKCILSLVNQTYKNFEHIIIDGGSTDNTIEIIKKYEEVYPVRWISEPDNGMYDAIYKGFSMGKGKVFAWINSDDFYFEWTLEVVARVFSQRKIEWLSGIPTNTKELGGNSITYLLPNLPTVYNTKMIARGMYDGRRMYFVQQESCFWTKKLWDSTGGLDTGYKMAGDYHLWRRFATKAKLYTINCSLASFRIHNNQKSGDMDGYYQEIDLKNRKYKSSLFLQIYLQLYSLVKYRKYVLNIDEIFKQG